MLEHVGDCVGTWKHIHTGLCCDACRKWYPETPTTTQHVLHEAELTVLLRVLTAEGERKRKDGA